MFFFQKVPTVFTVGDTEFMVGDYCKRCFSVFASVKVCVFQSDLLKSARQYTLSVGQYTLSVGNVDQTPVGYTGIVSYLQKPSTEFPVGVYWKIILPTEK